MCKKKIRKMGGKKIYLSSCQTIFFFFHQIYQREYHAIKWLPENCACEIYVFNQNKLIINMFCSINMIFTNTFLIINLF